MQTAACCVEAFKQTEKSTCRLHLHNGAGKHVGMGVLFVNEIYEPQRARNVKKDSVAWAE